MLYVNISVCLVWFKVEIGLLFNPCIVILVIPSVIVISNTSLFSQFYNKVNFISTNDVILAQFVIVEYLMLSSLVQMMSSIILVQFVIALILVYWCFCH